MCRYIDADEALKIIKKMLYETALNNFTTDRKFADACEEIAEHRLATWIDAVSTADVVEVVRCKDCVYYENFLCGRFSAYGDSVEEPEYDYCSYGERREDDGR